MLNSTSIDGDEIGHAMLTADFERDALLLRFEHHQGKALLDQALQAELGEFELELVRIDLGKIENVVDQTQQQPAAGTHGLQPKLLLLGQVRLEHQPAQADDGVERRANFVTHARQKLALEISELER